MVRIAIFTTDFPPTTGGESEYAANTAQELHNRGHKIVVFSSVGHRGRHSDYEVRDVLTSTQSTVRRSLNRLTDFDLVHVMNSAWLWTRRFGRPTFASIHGNDFISPNPVYGYDLKARLRLPKGDRIDHFLNGKRTRAAINRYFPTCKRVFSNSDFTRGVFLEHHPSCRDLVTTAGVGVDHGYLSSKLRSPAPRATKKLLTVCRLQEPRKNVDLVLRALGEIKQQFDYHYRVIGDGKRMTELQALARQLNIDDRVTFAGRVSTEEIGESYYDADLFVLPSGVSKSSFEGFGIVYLEANAMGVPTLAARVGGAQEAVDEGRSGYFVEQPTVTGIQKGLTEFLSGQRSFEPTVCRAFASQFTWARVVDHFESGYAAAGIA